jgi:hypothetical protein
MPTTMSPRAPTFGRVLQHLRADGPTPKDTTVANNLRHLDDHLMIPGATPTAREVTQSCVPRTAPSRTYGSPLRSRASTATYAGGYTRAGSRPLARYTRSAASISTRIAKSCPASFISRSSMIGKVSRISMSGEPRGIQSLRRFGEYFRLNLQGEGPVGRPSITYSVYTCLVHDSEAGASLVGPALGPAAAAMTVNLEEKQEGWCGYI